MTHTEFLDGEHEGENFDAQSRSASEKGSAGGSAKGGSTKGAYGAVVQDIWEHIGKGPEPFAGGEIAWAKRKRMYTQEDIERLRHLYDSKGGKSWGGKGRPPREFFTDTYHYSTKEMEDWLEVEENKTLLEENCIIFEWFDEQKTRGTYGCRLCSKARTDTWGTLLGHIAGGDHNKKLGWHRQPCGTPGQISDGGVFGATFNGGGMATVDPKLQALLNDVQIPPVSYPQVSFLGPTPGYPMASPNPIPYIQPQMPHVIPPVAMPHMSFPKQMPQYAPPSLALLANNSQMHPPRNLYGMPFPQQGFDTMSMGTSVAPPPVGAFDAIQHTIDDNRSEACPPVGEFDRRMRNEGLGSPRSTVRSVEPSTTRAPVVSEELRDGWRSWTTGDATYYYNTDGETKWGKPSRDLPSNWFEFYDDVRKLPYYQDAGTGTRTWDRPVVS